jgi:bacillithiol system protein YtxJ
MEWQNLTELSQLETIKNTSFERPQVIFKHSTTCSISKMAFSRFEKAEAPDGVDFYYLDLLQYRPISNAIAEQFEVFHESPQVLLIKNGACTYDESHYGIMMDELVEQIQL